MNLLFICHQFLPEHIGGTELYTLGLARRAQQAGHKVLVAHYVESPSGSPADFRLEYSEYEGIRTARIFYNLSLAEHPIRAEYYNTELRPFYQELHQQFRPGVVHHTHSMKVSASALHYFAEQGISNVLTMPDFWYICPRHTLIKWDGAICEGPDAAYTCAKCLHHTHRFLPQKIMSWPDKLKDIYFFMHDYLPDWPAAPQLRSDARAMRQRKDVLLESALLADHILVLSEFQRSVMIANGYPPERLLLTRHGLELEGLSPKIAPPVPGLPIRMTYIGSIAPHKGLHILLEAFAKTTNKQLSLTIYGSFSDSNAYQERLKRQAEGLRNCRLAGTFPIEDMGTVLGQTDVLAMPAQWYENEPLVVKAALYCHIPVMTTRMGSLPDMVDHEKTGWLLPRNDIPSWTDTLDSLSPDTLKTFSPGEHPIASMDAYFSDVHQLYKQLAYAKNNSLSC